METWPGVKGAALRVTREGAMGMATLFVPTNCFRIDSRDFHGRIVVAYPFSFYDGRGDTPFKNYAKNYYGHLKVISAMEF